MKRAPFLVSLLVCLFTAGASHAGGPAPVGANPPAAPAFKYQPFPSIPVVAIPANNFAQRLFEACNFARTAPGEAAKVLSTDLINACRALEDGKLSQGDLDTLRNARENPSALDLKREGQGGVASGFVPAAGAFGGLSDALIRGMAEFIAKRAQQEAMRYLEKRLKEELCDASKAPVTSQAFPNVCSALGTLDSSMSLEALGTYIRAAAEKDLRGLPDFSLAYAEFQAKSPSAVSSLFAARLGLSYFEAVRGGQAPLDALAAVGGIPAEKCEKSGCASVAEAVRWASAITYAMRQASDGWDQVFVTQNVPDLRTRAGAVLLLAEARRGKVLDVAHVNALIGQPAEWVDEVLALVTIWNNAKKQLEDSQNSAEQRREILLTAFVQSISATSRIVDSMASTFASLDAANVRLAARRMQTFADVGADLLRRDYGAAVITLAKELEQISPNLKMPKYLPLIVELATAKSSNDVAATFDAYAAPLGTYELKFQKPLVSIGAFFGGLAGTEAFVASKYDQGSPIIAPFAPIGLHLSAPVGPVHLGVMLSVLDVGALATYRVDDDEKGDSSSMEKTEVETSPQIGFEQVLSPGAYLAIGLFESPFILGAGASLAPKLRTVTETAASGAQTSDDVSVMRYGIFLAGDVPFAPLN